MELVHDFSVPVPAAQAWDLLTDVQKIAPCLPGAAITSVDGDSFEGGMKVKVGPIGMTFKGGGAFVEKDDSARRAVIEAKGRDAKGNGGAQATVTATLDEHDGVTDVHVVTNLNVTGKAAQFGGGVMKDISNRMLAQFADNLGQMIGGGGATSIPTAAAVSANGTGSAHLTAPTPASFTPSNDDGVDALGLLLGSDVVKNVVKPVAFGVAGLLVGYLYGKNRTLERIVRRVF
ncbi:SRPBCC family protein [Nocardioides sp. LS1]|uniref:SRPBCC family protein n=1 Tax=Nocardioides sp. LS1 TaxID=1027620 RepID=UPI000F623F4E|nr:SRPBCC family protein [Nocardioides sp. LS1]GCD88199.1 carbon monoxide dehydrogenase subunit G [Nocardioides sp. LS1]